MENHQSGFSFKIMSLGFKLRDLVKPRGKVLQEVGIEPGFQVLDFGCGPGGYILPLEKLIGESGKIFALDVNPAAILAVKSLALKHKLENITTIMSDNATELPDGSVDIVLLFDVLHHLKTLDAVLKELHRVLKPEGILSVTDHHLEKEDITSRISEKGLFRLSRLNKVHNFSKVIS